MIRKQLSKVNELSRKRNSYKTLNIIEINKSNLINNYLLFRNLNPDKKIIPVLKSNAYGHGLRQVTTILNEIDCSFIAVDGYFEAHKIKYLTKHKILVMGYVLQDNAKLLDNKTCSYVIQDIESLISLANMKKKFNIHMEINSGMNRLGIKPSEIDSYLKVLSQYESLTLEGIMTHLYDADNSNDTITKQQTEIFDSCVKHILKKGFNPKYIHIAQSAGSVKCKSIYANCIRVGIGLYGINPLSPVDKKYYLLNSLKPVLELKSTIIKIHNLKPKQKVSYNGIYQTKINQRIGVLPIGYYEWVPRELSNVGIFSNKKRLLPIRGRVCMNHTMIDLSNTKLKKGDSLTLISVDKNMPNSIENISKQYGMFSYSLLTSINETIRRVIV